MQVVVGVMAAACWFHFDLILNFNHEIKVWIADVSNQTEIDWSQPALINSFSRLPSDYIIHSINQQQSRQINHQLTEMEWIQNQKLKKFSFDWIQSNFSLVSVIDCRNCVNIITVLYRSPVKLFLHSSILVGYAN